ncbi:MAG: hypothetical protein C4B59_03440 [Candidatus Methanogaster sp.]|uniref:Uncharacterized protein n=1 Tax=Candidatus Methanogaster sp. TaxID=3386292 RepID=A0AC61L551_9EURY|nr:MAG: hypothetical protein C4B59_03440 [ANME-2 cluster archaeon]
MRHPQVRFKQPKKSKHPRYIAVSTSRRPDGAIFVHSDIGTPFKCDLCDGDPVCANVCPKKAILFVPEHMLGQVHRMASALGCAHLQEVEYWEHGIKKTLRYADIGEDKLE